MKKNSVCFSLHNMYIYDFKYLINQFIHPLINQNILELLKESNKFFLTPISLKSSNRLSFSGTDSRWSKATRVL